MPPGASVLISLSFRSSRRSCASVLRSMCSSSPWLRKKSILRPSATRTSASWGRGMATFPPVVLERKRRPVRAGCGGLSHAHSSPAEWLGRGTMRSWWRGLGAAPVTPPPASPVPLPTSFARREELLLDFRVGRLVELAFSDDRIGGGRDLVAALEFDLFLFALLDLGDADDMLVFGDPEDRHALGVAAHDPDVAHRGADHLALVGDQHQRLALVRGEGRDDAAIALRRVDVGDALTAAVGSAIFIGRRALAVAVLGDREDELLPLRQLGDALRRQRAIALLFALPGGEAQIILTLFLAAHGAAGEDRHRYDEVVAKQAD